MAEADLTQTQAALVAAQADLTNRDAAAAAHAVGGGQAPVGACGRGRAAVDGVPAAPAASDDAGTLAHDVIAPGALGAEQAPSVGGAIPGGAPFGTDAPGDQADDEEVDGGDPDGCGSWNPVRRNGGGAGPSRRWSRNNLDGVASYDDGFDFYKSYTPSDWLQGFDILRAVVRPDGMPMPFTRADPVRTATFPVGSRDELEARH